MKVPSAFYYLTNPADSGIPPALQPAQLTNPNIVGFRWRQAHYSIQTAQNTYNWAPVDAALDALIANGNKKLGLGIVLGIGIARWVYDDAGVEEFILDPANDIGSMPNI